MAQCFRLDGSVAHPLIGRYTFTSERIDMQKRNTIFRWLRVIRKRRKPSVPKYTQNGFEGQVNYNLWSTSRTRFSASKRLSERNQLSGQTISFASAYVILLSVVQIYIDDASLNSFLTFINISLAIMILVISQVESGANYSLRSSRLHDCGLAINTLYKKLRRLKSQKESMGSDEYLAEITKIDEEYDETLKLYENHLPIDYEMFKASYPKYVDHGLGWFEVKKIKLCYYIRVRMFYHAMIYLPPFALVALAFYHMVILKQPNV
ncbi:SLATT domain-containing protein [Vibrio vulnificus]|nr:SLATT domain-containing protein [Vibrio vulnificus]